jgi:uncharacterized damage-inducible protein DinB
MDQQRFRKNLVELLQGSQAHINVSKATLNVPRKYRTVRPPGMSHSAWELLEHMRRAQEDIIRYTLDAGWESPPFPEGYWPKNPPDIPDNEWRGSISALLADLDEVVALANNLEIDLTSRLPHGEGRTYLRQVLLVADHNSYHLGQFILAKKALGLEV